MEKWKIIVVVLLLGGVAGYGVLNSSTEGRPLQSEQGNRPEPPPEPPEDWKKFINKPASAWNIPQQFWINTPQPITLNDLKGHITVLEFFRIGCPHCEEAVPSMNALHQKYGPRGLKMVAFQSPDEDFEKRWNTVQSTLLHRWKVTYPVAFDKDAALLEKFGLNTYPVVFVLDRQGVIRYYQTGHSKGIAQQVEQFVTDALEGKTSPVSKDAKKSKGNGKV